MGAGHDHSHSHGAGANSKMLALALGLTTIFLIAELIGSFVFNSLALLSDAAHMFTDAAALAIALAAVKVGQRPADNERTFGYRRFEILAAAFNALLLFAVAGYVLLEAAGRFYEPVEVQTGGMLAVAAVGLVVNIVAMRLLSAGKENSLNVKGAYLEVWADMLGSIGVILGAGIIMLTGWQWIDPLVAVGIGLWVLPRTWILLRDTTHVLLEGVPRGLDLSEIRSAISGTAGVAGVHDLHVWSLTSDDISASVHIELSDAVAGEAVRLAVTEVFAERFDIEHVTVQVEQEACSDASHVHP
ncbi:cation diffusion facilitator family transporter [Allosphingosinicella vermicomposti]|uniref:cation diffusion facilitator family transporter n=1 Tax=Allosphingosinicella vermicomposti TaxID=614671 RepID=UPI000D0FC08A|nr:cation diffusion facilitator family transporter [Allosphingosinicella vermicomposti]